MVTRATPDVLSLNSNPHSILIGEGIGNPINAAIPGTSNIPLVSTGATTDPTFAPLSLTGPGITGTLSINTGGTNNNTYTNGSVIFYNGTALAENNPRFFWDNTNNRLGIGINTPTVSLHVIGNSLVTGSSNVNGSITVNAAGVFGAAGLAISAPSGNLVVGGTGTFGSSLTVNGTGIAISAPHGNLSIAGSGVFGSDVGITGSLNATVNVNATGNLTGTNANISNGIAVGAGGMASGGSIDIVTTSNGSGIGIICPNPVVEFQHPSAGGNTWVLSHNSSALFTWSFNTAGRASLDQFGNLNIAGTLTQASDLSLKDNITNLDSVIDKVMKLRPIKFSYKDEPNVFNIGLIAQELEEQFPELVTEIDNKKGIAYANLSVVLLRTVQELKNEINLLKTKMLN